MTDSGRVDDEIDAGPGRRKDCEPENRSNETTASYDIEKARAAVFIRLRLFDTGRRRIRRRRILRSHRRGSVQ